MAVNLATAYVEMIPTARGINKAVEQQFAPASQIAEQAGRESGEKFTQAAEGKVSDGGSRIGNALKSGLGAGAKVAGAAVTAVLGVSIAKGFSRMTAIEDATAKLKGFGHSADAVTNIMANALTSVKGTAYGLDEAATTAAGAVAAGIEPGQELERVLKVVANSAGAAGSSMGDMGAIFNKVATTNKAGNDVLNQVADRGINIYGELAKQIGVTSEEVFAMSSEGKINFEMFEQAMTAASGTAANELGKTTTGALKNLTAALGRFGAGLIGGVFPVIGPVFSSLTGWVDKATEKVGPMVSAFSVDLLGALSSVYNILAKRDFTGPIFGLQDDSKLVAFLINVHDKARLFHAGLSMDSLTRQEFAGQLNGIITVGMKLRGWFDKLNTAAHLFHAGITMDRATREEFAGQLHGIITVGMTLRAGLDEMAGSVRAFGAAWTANDGDITSSGLPGFMEHTAYVAHQAVDAIARLDFGSWQGFTDSLSVAGGTIGSALGPAMSSMGESLKTLAPAAKEFAKELPNIGGAVAKIAAVGLTVLTSGLGFLADHVDTIIKYMPAIVAGFVLFRVAMLAAAAGTLTMQAAQLAMTPVITLNNILRLTAIHMENRQTAALAANTAATHVNASATIGQGLAQARTTLAAKALALATGQITLKTIAMAAASKVAAAGTLIMAGAQKAAAAAGKVLNLVLKANPIGIIITAVAALVAGFVWFFTQTEVGQKIVQVAWASIKAAIAVVGDWITGTLVPALATAWEAIKAGAMWVYEKGIKPAFDAVYGALETVGNFVLNTIVPGLQAAWEGIAAGARWLYGIFEPVFSAIGTVVNGFWLLARGIFQVAVSFIVNYLAPAFVNFYEGVILPVFQAIGDTVTGWWNGAVNIFNTVVNFVRDTLGGAFTWLRDTVINPVFTWVGDFVSQRMENLRNNFNMVVGFVRDTLGGAFTWLRDTVITPVFTWIGDFVSQRMTNLRNNFDMIVGFVRDTLGTAFTWLRDTIITPVWNGITSLISGVWENGVKPVFEALRGFIMDTIPEAFQTGVDAVGKAWDKLQEVAKKPVKFVVNRVINDGLIANFNKLADKMPGVDRLPDVALPAGFARGGIIPGYQAQKKDDVLTPMRRGEGVLVPEAVRAVGPSWVNRINAAANAGGVGAAKKAHAATAGEGNIGGFFTGNAATIQRHGALYLDVAAGMGDWGFDQAARMWDGAAGVKVKTGRGNLQARVSPLERGGGILGYTTGNDIDMSPSWMRQLGAQQRKTVAAHEIGHALGLPHNSRQSIMQPNLGQMAATPTALDIRNLQSLFPGGTGRAGSGGGTGKDLMNEILGPFKKIATGIVDSILAEFPGGGMMVQLAKGVGNKVMEGISGFLNSAVSKIGEVASDVWDGAKKLVGLGASAGGIVPTLYDQGGQLPPGVSVVANRTRRPEPILTGDQWDALTGDGGAGSTTIYVKHPLTGEWLLAEMEEIAVGATSDAIEESFTRSRRGGKYQGAGTR